MKCAVTELNRPGPVVVSVQCSAGRTFSKAPCEVIRLIADVGVEGDAHAGRTDKHRYHMRKFGEQPNLRQVHLMPAELFDALAHAGHVVQPGDLGDNIATRNLDLLNLPTGTRLRVGPQAIVELTGLRNPCHQIEAFQPGLLAHVVSQGPGGIVRKAGVMGIVVQGGPVRADDGVEIDLPALPHIPLVYRIPTAPPPASTRG